MFDVENLLSDKQAVTATAASTNFINLGSPKTPPGSPAPLKRDIGAGNRMPIGILVTTAFAGLTSLEATIQVDDNSSFSSPKEVGTTGTIVNSRLVAGLYLPITMIPIGADEQYLRINYTVVGTGTAGNISAGIVTEIPAHG